MGRKGQVAWNKGKKNVYKEEALEQMRLSALADVSTDRIIELYKEGNSCDEVALILGTNHSVVWRRLILTGLLRDKGCGNRGRKFGIEHCKAISDGQKRLRNDPLEKERLCIGVNNPFYGKKHKPETIEAMKQKLRVMMSGASNPQWRGGKSLEPYSSKFKREIRYQIYNRDNYKCQKCGIIHRVNSGKLVAHHKDFDKYNCLLDNLITLCRPCHGKITMGARWSKEVAKT